MFCIPGDHDGDPDSVARRVAIAAVCEAASRRVLREYPPRRTGRPRIISKPSEIMTEHEVAAFVKMSIATVRRWRLFRTGPKFVKIGSAVRYCRQDVDTWLNSCAATATGK
jgi:predicted DNA-binding transcriptional regulator AlpA